MCVCVIYVTSVLASLQAWIYTEKKNRRDLGPGIKDSLLSFVEAFLSFFRCFF